MQAVAAVDLMPTMAGLLVRVVQAVAVLLLLQEQQTLEHQELPTQVVVVVVDQDKVVLHFQVQVVMAVQV